MVPSENHMPLVNCSLLLTITYPPPCGTQNQTGRVCLQPALSWTLSSPCVKAFFFVKKTRTKSILPLICFHSWLQISHVTCHYPNSHKSALPSHTPTFLSSCPLQTLPGCSWDLPLRSATLQVDRQVRQRQGVCRLKEPTLAIDPSCASQSSVVRNYSAI